jgi:hypothetical protein
MVWHFLLLPFLDVSLLSLLCGHRREGRFCSLGVFLFIFIFTRSNGLFRCAFTGVNRDTMDVGCFFTGFCGFGVGGIRVNVSLKLLGVSQNLECFF